MKKYISMMMLTLAVAFGMGSCSTETDESAGGTAVEKMAGFWDVQVDVVDKEGNMLSEDYYGLGTVSITTYNTAANTADSMWIQDASFYGVQMKVAVKNYALGTFEATPNASYDPSNAKAGHVEFLKGQVLYGQGKNLHGIPCDSICYTVKFDDDSDGFIYRVSGVRHSGFYE